MPKMAMTTWYNGLVTVSRLVRDNRLTKSGNPIKYFIKYIIINQSRYGKRAVVGRQIWSDFINMKICAV